MSFLEKQISS